MTVIPALPMATPVPARRRIGMSLPPSPNAMHSAVLMPSCAAMISMPRPLSASEEMTSGTGEHFLSGGAGVYALDGQHASEDLVHDRAVVVHDGPILSHDQGRNAPAVGGSEDGPHVLRVDGGAGYRLSAYGADRAVDSDVAVDEVQDGVEVVDQRGGPSGGDEYPHTGLMRRGQCPDSGCRHRMGPEAD